ncbi:MAG: hypothetical protein WCH83_04765, partial [Alphaproteobacteria bacterium]
ILKRLTTAKAEIHHWRDFDYVLVNDDLDKAFAGLQAILAAERLKRSRRPLIASLITDLDRDLGRVLDAGDLSAAKAP